MNCNDIVQENERTDNDELTQEQSYELTMYRLAKRQIEENDARINTRVSDLYTNTAGLPSNEYLRLTQMTASLRASLEEYHMEILRTVLGEVEQIGDGVYIASLPKDPLEENDDSKMWN